MLNPFPNLLTYGFFAPTLLRLAAAITLIYSAQFVVRNRQHLAQTSFPIIGKPGEWYFWFGGIVLLLDAFFLFIGLGTQWAALVGALVALKLWGLSKKIGALSRPAALLLLAICISLLLTGAGALAFDLPL